MKASTEEFLYILLWTADSVVRPTWYNLESSFESWAHREGLSRRLAILERLKLLERQAAPNMTRVCRLTADGRRAALGGCDPEERWDRPWDGRWRMVLFDLPVRATALRIRMRRFLLRMGFGYLQQSVWITPDSLEELHRRLRDLPVDVGSLTLIEGCPCGGETDAELVDGAWDFLAINAQYARHETILGQCPEMPSRHAQPSPEFWFWARRERAVWKAAVRLDPLLPRGLLPAGYLGCRAWETRKEHFRRMEAAFSGPDSMHSEVQP